MVNVLFVGSVLGADVLLFIGRCLSVDYYETVDSFTFTVSGCILMATTFLIMIVLQGSLWSKTIKSKQRQEHHGTSTPSSTGSDKPADQSDLQDPEKATTIATPFILGLLTYILVMEFSDRSKLTAPVVAFIAIGPAIEYIAVWSCLAVGLAIPPTPKEKVTNGPESGLVSKTELQAPAA